MLGVATEVRSTLITSSVEALKKLGRMSDYERLVAREHKEVILSTVAGEWLQMGVAMAHYEAMDKLGFTTNEAIEIGRGVGDKIHGTFLGTMVKMASSVGVTPWFSLGYTAKLYSRLFRGGGGASVVKLGPKEARADVVGVPLLAIPYWRAGLRGLYRAGCELFCQRTYVNEMPLRTTATTTSLRISWV
jgi:hypothetical protein